MKLRTWERRVNNCKKRHRPKLKDWARDGFANKREQDFLSLKVTYSQSHPIQKLNAAELSVARFIDEYERKSIPCIISNIPTLESWRAGLYSFDNHSILMIISQSINGRGEASLIYGIVILKWARMMMGTQ
jgi:hypothetical protein